MSLINTISNSYRQLLGNRIRPTDERFGEWLLMENVYNDRLVTDIGLIDYTEGREHLSPTNIPLPLPITEPFCDNIMVIKIYNVTDCEPMEKNCKKPVLKRQLC